jgi:hypothetical protein
MAEPPVIKLDLFASYLSMIAGAVNSRQWRHLYAQVNGRRQDLLGNGRRSCAFFVSGLLTARGLLQSMHATVAGTVQDLEASGWVRIKRPRKGAVLVWEQAAQVGPAVHPHIGFYVGPQRAISNSSKRGVPVRHHWTYGTRANGQPKRRITAIYWHPSFPQPDRR